MIDSISVMVFCLHTPEICPTGSESSGLPVVTLFLQSRPQIVCFGRLTMERSMAWKFLIGVREHDTTKSKLFGMWISYSTLPLQFQV